MSLVEEANEEEEDKWIEESRTAYDEIRRIVYSEKPKEEKGLASTGSNKNTLQLKKMEAPKFKGDVKTYARFRQDFLKFVQPGDA